MLLLAHASATRKVESNALFRVLKIDRKQTDNRLVSGKLFSNDRRAVSVVGTQLRETGIRG